MSVFVDRIFWDVLSEYPGAVKIGEIVQENEKSQLCCDPCFTRENECIASSPNFMMND